MKPQNESCIKNNSIQGELTKLKHKKRQQNTLMVTEYFIFTNIALHNQIVCTPEN